MNPRLLEIKLERQALYLQLAALEQEEYEILTETERTDEVDAEMPDFSIFKDTTCRLLEAMWDAPDRMMSQEDIREYVILDEYASDKAVKHVIARARQEVEDYEIEIKNIHGKGYQLIAEK
jgi:DNA-binding response OmpR family regulator